MKLFVLAQSRFLIFLLCTVPTGFTALVAANEGSLAFVGATLIDGTDAAPLKDSVIVITNGRISAVGPRGAVTVPDDALVIDHRL